MPSHDHFAAHNGCSCADHDGSALEQDLALLDMLSGPALPTVKHRLSRRDAVLDPLLLAAAAMSGPHITRNHYHHDFFPGVALPTTKGSYDWTKWVGEDASAQQDIKKSTYRSRQAPRRVRLQAEGKEADRSEARSQTGEAIPSPTSITPSKEIIHSPPHPTSTTQPLLSSPSISDPSNGVRVKCMARTRIPTPHGLAFLHLYHNNVDSKEHLAIVVDPAQLSDDGASSSATQPIRSASLDAVWSDTETDMDRITRGAYVGRLSATSQNVSSPLSKSNYTPHPTLDRIPAPLVRIHSECFTGETIGSMRCDCGEQLDEAIRLMSQPVLLPPAVPHGHRETIPGRGVVVYMRQEGRGIGLLSKIRAYNLQDLGHDTVAANLMLGHGADERRYDVAIAILRDLGLGSEAGEGVKLLTNNPDKVHAMEKEGLKIVERVPMVPRSWRKKERLAAPHVVGLDGEADDDEVERIPGATMVGGHAVHGDDLEKYLRTKVLRMGHMLPLH